jgi:hypothetical protein
MDDALGDGFSSKSGCFRHQVLLCRQRHWHVIDSWREHGFAECEHDSHRFQKSHRRLEDLPQRQPPASQPRLHCWCPDLASEFQRPVRPDEVVIAAKQTPGDFRDAPSIGHGISSAEKDRPSPGGLRLGRPVAGPLVGLFKRTRVSGCGRLLFESGQVRRARS